MSDPPAAEGFRSKQELLVAKLSEADLKELGVDMKARQKLLKALAPPPPLRKFLPQLDYDYTANFH